MADEAAPLLDRAPNELRVVLELSGPLIAIQLLEVVPSSVNGMLTGHLATGDAESRLFLAAIGLGGLFFTVFVYSVAIGVSASMDALCSQAFGKGAIRDMGYIFQTGVLCAALLYLPLSLLCFFSADILVGLGQSLEIAQAAQHLTRIMIVGIPFVFGYEFLKRVLQGQTILYPILAAIAVGNVVNAAASYALMYHTPLGYTGSALSAAFLNAAGCGVMLNKVRRLEPWSSGFEWSLAEALKRLPHFAYLSANGVGMVLFELIGMAIPSFIAGRLPAPAVAMSANTIYMAFRYLFTMVYLGISFAAGIRVGNALGRGDADSAQQAAWYSLKLSVAWAAIATVAMVAFGPLYARGYTTDEAILSVANDLFWYTGPAQIAIGVWATAQGIFRGIGHPHQGAVANFVGFLLVGVPLGYHLGFGQGWGIVGLWAGTYAGFSLCAFYGLYWLYVADWNSMVKEVETTFELSPPAKDLLA
ncbi:Multidrug/Oligosaccharidyl-lipid/Polysaccharide (MOP) Flippase Superfamily [Achlya hypogyna]|uniref:Multidrug/Oligosaccharidyl-lipid/Polysaccharide (MOP) Flippase Superfamily n=1 Tax=Achlya hypogyna TaxID=1202772 RepID=A0A1V9ZRY8_ACHHY|nr:Multidrug/Oligosaccharidyl-lipid/Polysaccharide (MOP) Flippase Superfamily [Achlya hypogyna]